MNDAKKSLFKVVYTGSVERYKNRFSIELATSEREAVRQSYARVHDLDYFPQDDGTVLDCDGNIIQNKTEDTIYYDGGYYIAFEIQYENDDLDQVMNLDGEKEREIVPILQDALNILFNSKKKKNGN
jgi:hypothetical protein